MPAEWSFSNRRWEKICSGCKHIFISNKDDWAAAFQEFTKYFDVASHSSRSSDELNALCKECKGHRSHKRDHNGLSRSEMLEAQGFTCTLCPNTIDIKTSRFDHDHDTGKIRSLLCHSCNLRMNAVDDVEWLDKAIAYRNKFQCE